MSILKCIKNYSLNLSYIINNNVKIILLLGLVNYIYIIKKILDNKYRFILLFFIILSSSYFIFKNFFIITTILILFDISDLIKLDIIEGANSNEDYNKLLDGEKKNNKKNKKKNFLDDDEKDLMKNVDVKKTGKNSNKNTVRKLDNPSKGETPFKKNIKINSKDADKLTSL